MSSQSIRFRQEPASLAGDFWGGIASTLVALPSSIAFGVLIYSGLGTQYAGMGAMAGILGAVALGIIAPLVGRTGGLISAPCAPSAAVLSALVVGLLEGRFGIALTPSVVLPLLAVTGLLSSGLQILYGAIGGGRLIKFIPYPVVSGYLSGVAVLIVLGQLPKLFGLPTGTPLLSGVMSPALWKWQGLVVGLATMAAMVGSRRITRQVPSAIFGLAAGVAVYFLLAFFSRDLLTLEGNPLIIGSIQASGSFVDSIAEHVRSLFTFDLAALQLIVIPALTLSVLLSIDTLKTCVGLDALTRTRHRSDRELIGQGIGNLVACSVGGMPGAGTMGPTLVNVASGGRTSRSGVIEGAFVLIALFALGNLVAWVPIGALAGILMVIAWTMFDKNIVRLLRYPAGRLDFTVIAGVILVSVTVDLIAAAGVGVALAILLFIRDQMRGSVIRRKLYLNQTSSKTLRLPSEREILNRLGNQGVYCELQGNLFFGTTDQLFTQLEPDLRKCRYVLLDLRRVQSMDYTAAHLFEQMHTQLEEKGGQLLFSGMPSGMLDQRNFERYLQEIGVVREGGGVMVSETLDGGLEWIEQKILEGGRARKLNEAAMLEVRDFDLFRGFSERTLRRIAGLIKERSCASGEKVFAQGDVGDEVFLVRRGSVRIMLPLEKGKYHHLATIGRGDFFGEVVFLDRGHRSADAVAKVRTELFVFSRLQFNKLSRSDATVGVQIFARVAHALALRLRQADAELRTLEER